MLKIILIEQRVKIQEPRLDYSVLPNLAFH